MAVLTVMHFNKKADVHDVPLHGSDSLTFTAAVRHLYGVVDDKENKRRLLIRGNNNAAWQDQKALGSARRWSADKNGVDIWAPYMIFDPGPIEISAADAMAGASAGRPSDARRGAKDLLRRMLAMGPAKMKDTIAKANAEGVSPATVARAKMKLGIGSRENDNGVWYWFLPDKAEAD